MIEMVYSGRESQEQTDIRIPKNIRQMGGGIGEQKIYIEDYVLTQIKKTPQKEDSVKYGVLLGDISRSKGNTYIFVKAMVEVRDIIENSLIFNDDIWSAIYKDIKQYFKNMNIIGWFASVPYRVSDDLKGIKKLHLDNFAGNDKVCFFSDRTEKEESFYMYKKGRLERQKGYYIYYEKNDKMKKYVKNIGNEENVKNVEDKNKEKEVKQAQVPAQSKSSGPKSFREAIKEETQTGRQGRVAYGISGLLIVALLLSTVVMLNNYGELKNIKQTLSGLTMDKEAKAVNQLLEGYNETTTIGMETTKTDTTETEKNNGMEQVTNPQPSDSTGSADSNQTQQITQKQTEKAVKSSLSGTYYKVKAGQTLYDISMKVYGTSEMVDEIKEHNDIDDDYTIIEGEKILLP